MREAITSRHNPLLAHFKKLLTVRAYRAEHREFAADGVKLLAEAVRWNCPLTAVLVQEGVELPELPAGVRVAEVSEALMRSVSLMEAPQGALFACRMPEDSPAKITPGCVVLDGIQDPGNLGTILRTADALDVPVILTEGCADAYNPKVVRASMGAVLRTPPRGLKKADVVRACREQGVQLLATAMSADARDVRDAALSSAATVIGSEGRGVCPELLAAADGKVIIPMSARCESLNAAVAATIVMWQMRR